MALGWAPWAIRRAAEGPIRSGGGQGQFHVPGPISLSGGVQVRESGEITPHHDQVKLALVQGAVFRHSLPLGV
jgi:hypothetical protein